jgi:hypothetical protein
LFEVAFGEVEEPLALDIIFFVEALYMCCQLEMKATTIRFAQLLTTTYTVETVRRSHLLVAAGPNSGEIFGQ